MYNPRRTRNDDNIGDGSSYFKIIISKFILLTMKHVCLNNDVENSQHGINETYAIHTGKWNIFHDVNGFGVFGRTIYEGNIFCCSNSFHDIIIDGNIQYV